MFFKGMVFLDTELLSKWLGLLRAPGLGARKRRELLDTLGSVDAIAQITEPQARALQLKTETIAALRKPSERSIEQDLAWFAAGNRRLLTLGAADFPAALAACVDAPVALFADGDVQRLHLPSIAIVGSRGATVQGMDFARALAENFSGRGLTVVSGLAMGIDAAAHAGALVGPGSTAAVLATGLDRMYPKQNSELATKILAEGGVIVSEMPLGTAPLPELFPQRNRIISGLSLGVVVVEASVQSGSLVTARFAGEQNREVFAVPGSIHNPMARGCHQLIRQGAKLVESAEDVLVELRLAIADQLPKAKAAARKDTSGLGTRQGSKSRAAQSDQNGPQAQLPLAAEDQQLVDALGFDPISIDQLVDRTGMSIPALSSTLLRLELDGVVAALSGARYQRRV
jgi:DNA processing protein